jgi:SAM-dependent methyltransferase
MVGITLSGRQAGTAAGLVAAAGLADRVQVIHGDYHQLPFADATFDAVLFLESLGYARSLVQLFQDVHRVLKAGGGLYIKDVFRREHLWSDQEAQELAEFDRVYAHRTPTISECAAAAADVGFAPVATRELSSVMSTADARRAMFDEAGSEPLSSFGRLHYCRHSCLPVYFAELTARARLT